MDVLATRIELELERQAHPLAVSATAEPWSWRIGDAGHIWLEGTDADPRLVVQRLNGRPFPEPFATDHDDIERVVGDALRVLS